MVSRKREGRSAWLKSVRLHILSRIGSCRECIVYNLGLCKNSELYEQKLHFWKLSLLFFKTHNACANQPCSNRCCEENPCSNGGTCTELCHHAKQKFNCTCAIGYVGKLCERKSPTSCKQLQLEAKNSKPKNSTVYTLYDPASKSFYQTFCDLTSEHGFVWTLLESFSRLGNNNDFKAQPFDKDYPVNQNSFKWNKFRLTLDNKFNAEPFYALPSNLQL